MAPVPAGEAENEVPLLDEYGVLHRGAAWVALSPLQESVVIALMARFGQPVGRDEICARAWPDGEPVRGLDTHMAKLRARIRPLGLEVHTIRGRGFVLTG